MPPTSSCNFAYTIEFLNCIYLLGHIPIPHNASTLTIISCPGKLSLPQELPQHLKLIGPPFSEKLKLPNNVLSFESNFFTPNALPSSLTKICFGLDFNSPIDKVLLPNLQFASFRGIFNQPLDNLPESLTFLRLRSKKYSHSLNDLPSSLHTLKLHFIEFNGTCAFKQLPFSLRILKVCCPSLAGKFIDNTQDNQIPPELEYLTFHCFKGEIIHCKLPETLVSLTIKGAFCAILPPLISRSTSVLPESLEVLDFGNVSVVLLQPLTNTKRVIRMLNSNNLRSLAFPDFFNMVLNFRVNKAPCTNVLSCWLPNLTNIQFGVEFNHPINNLPPTIQSIVFSAGSNVAHFNQKLRLVDMPVLREFKFSGSSVFNQPLDEQSFPQCLKILQLVGMPTIQYPNKYVKRKREVVKEIQEKIENSG
jgi:hypothetical protein